MVCDMCQVGLSAFENSIFWSHCYRPLATKITGPTDWQGACQLCVRRALRWSASGPWRLLLLKEIKSHLVRKAVSRARQSDALKQLMPSPARLDRSATAAVRVADPVLRPRKGWQGLRIVAATGLGDGTGVLGRRICSEALAVMPPIVLGPSEAARRHPLCRAPFVPAAVSCSASRPRSRTI